MHKNSIFYRKYRENKKYFTISVLRLAEKAVKRQKNGRFGEMSHGKCTEPEDKNKPPAGVCRGFAEKVERN